MKQKLPESVIQVIVEGLESGNLIQKQARLCDLAAIDAIPSDILPWLKLNHLHAIAQTTPPVTAIQTVASQRILIDLAHSKHKEVKLAILKNQNIPPAALTILSTDSDNEIHALVLRHRQTPGEILLKFSHDFRGGRYLGYTTVAEITREAASRPSTNPEMLRELSQHENWKVRTAVAKNPSTPVDILEILVDKPVDNNNREHAAFVRKGVAQNPAAPIEILEKLAGSWNELVRNSVGRNPNTPISLRVFLQERLAKGKYDVYEMLGNPLTPSHILANIAKSISDVMWLKKIAKHPNTPSTTLAELSTRSLGMWSNRLRIAVAENPNTPADILSDLATDPYKEVSTSYDQKRYGRFLIQIAVASNPNTPVEILELFYKEKDLFVCQALAKNPQTPTNWLRSLAVQDDYIVHLYRGSNRSNAKIESIQNTCFQRTFSDNIHRALAENTSTPMDMLEELAGYRDVLVKLAVAKNISTPLYILEKLSHCKNNWIKETAQSRIRSIYRKIATNPETSTKQLQEMLKHSDVEVRLAVILHPQGLNLLIDRCLKPERCFPEQNSLHRVLAGMHPQISTTQLEILCYSENWFDRLAIACNPKTPQEYLEQLAKDSNPLIQQTAQYFLYI